MKTILIGGGTGLVGTRLSELLEAKGYGVIHLSRTKNLDARFPAYEWDPMQGSISEAAIEKADAVINLAGAGIADAHWTRKRKKLIIDSRVMSTRVLKAGFKKAEKKPAAFLSASAGGYYGDRGDTLLTEDMAPGQKGFLPQSCIAWEHAIKEVVAAGWRTAWLRIGLVCSTQGGALEKIMQPLRFRIGAYFGDGQQWYSWVHIDDLCRMFIYALEQEAVSGVFNAVAPNPVRNKDFVAGVVEATGKSALVIPAPEFVLRMGMGELADAIISSQKLSSGKIEATGFEFKYPHLLPALKDLIENGK